MPPIARRSALLAVTLLLLAPPGAISSTITYVDAQFEGGASDVGGGSTFVGFGSATNVSPSNLDGGALEFGRNTQLVWNRGGLPESTIHRVSFDYYAEPGGNVTQFLDVPSILRLDVSATGRHSVVVEYNLAAKTAVAFLDGTLDISLLTVLAWPTNAVSATVRLGNQSAPPGNSTGIFQIDNLLWQGFTAQMPEPGTLGLLALGLAGLLARRRS